MVHCVKSVYLFAARLGERLFLKTNLVKKELAPWISRAAWTSSMRILRGVLIQLGSWERERYIYIYIYVSMRGVRTYLYERSIYIVL